MDFSLLLESYGEVWTSLQVILMTLLGACGGVLLGAIPGMTATMGVALLIPFFLWNGFDSLHWIAVGYLLWRNVWRIYFCYFDPCARYTCCCCDTA